MLDSLLKNKFYRKCKSAINLTKARIEIIKRKRTAMQKYLKIDVVDLLKDGLDNNAYSRAEGLLVELNLSSCYDLVDKFCDHVLENLSVMSKLRECPEEYKEAASSLICAAARFADLPELRQLRSIFRERYGNTLDCYASKEFVEKLKLTHPTKDATIELMQHLAAEGGVQWENKATEENLSNPPLAFGQTRSNVGDKLQASERPNSDKLSYITNNNGKIKSLKAIQEDNTGRKEQGKETVPQTSSHVPEEEFPDKKTFNYNPVPPYTKSRISDHRNDDEGKIRLDSVNDYDSIGISEGGSTTSSTEKDNSESGQKRKELAPQDDQLDGEERWLDRLLMYYSRKRTKLYTRIVNTESTKSVKSPPKQDIFSRMTRMGASWDFRSTKPALSFPTEQKIESEETNQQEHIRSTSLPPEMLKGGHVHPKLPDDYDDFLAHLAAITKGENLKN